MVDIDELVERSGTLKGELLEFTKRPQFSRALKQTLVGRFGNPVVAEEHEIENFFDWFVQQYRRPDGRTVVDCFLETRADLPAEEREMLLGWRDVVEGVFEITGREGPELVTVSLIDDLEYRMRSNVGPAIFDRFADGGFVVTRLVAVGDRWLISGISSVLGAEERDRMLTLAARQAMQRPDLVYRNPERLARGWELQQEDRAAFVEHFGADLVVLARAEVREQLRGWRRNAGPQLGEEWVESIVDALGPAESVGLIYDETDGLGVFADYRLVEEAFTEPDLASTRPYRKLLKAYLTDDTVSPVALIRLAERDHHQADRVFRSITGKPSLRWAEHGEALLRTYKPTWYDTPPMPRTVVISDRLVPYLSRTMRPAER